MIQFIHINNKPRLKNEGVITVAYSVLAEHLRVGVSFCSPKESFCKKTGRRRASRRMDCRRFTRGPKSTHAIWHSDVALRGANNTPNDLLKELAIDEVNAYLRNDPPKAFKGLAVVPMGFPPEEDGFISTKSVLVLTEAYPPVKV